MCIRPLGRTLALGLLFGAAGCGSATGPAELATARLRWAQVGPASYRMTIFRSCECLPEMTGPVVVTVERGVVASRHYVATGSPVEGALAEQFPSVEGLFALIDAMRRQRVARLDVQYDAALGHPVHVAIDVDAMMADDEVTYTVTDLQPR